MTHSPAPWRVEVGNCDNQEVCDLQICGDIFVLAKIDGPQYAHQHANARLIAAAPELLALVIQYRDDLKRPPHGDSIYRRMEAIDAAIANSKWLSHRILRWTSFSALF